MWLSLAKNCKIAQKYKMAKKIQQKQIIWPIQQHILIPAFDNDQINFFFSSKLNYIKTHFNQNYGTFSMIACD